MMSLISASGTEMCFEAAVLLKPPSIRKCITKFDSSSGAAVPLPVLLGGNCSSRVHTAYIPPHTHYRKPHTYYRPC
jgi:hypothetical protein